MGENNTPTSLKGCEVKSSQGSNHNRFQILNLGVFLKVKIFVDLEIYIFFSPGFSFCLHFGFNVRLFGQSKKCIFSPQKDKQICELIYSSFLCPC